MKVALDIHGYGVASMSDLPVAEGRVGALPAPKFHSRKARMPGLAWELCRRALGEESLGEGGSVLVGTALGCLTETAAFVENMIREDGAAPKPRAFTASVHNAIASEVARKLGARGECQTFVQGELSHVATLFAASRARARGAQGPQVVGALDEWTDYVARGRAECDGGSTAAEGGALFYLAGTERSNTPLARISQIALARPRDPAAWFATRCAPVERVLCSAAGSAVAAELALETTPWTGDFPAAGAVAMALGTALLCGEAQPAAFGLETCPRSLGVLSCTRFGEWGWVAIEAAPR